MFRLTNSAIVGVIFLTVLYQSVPIEGISFDEYVTLSQNQKSALDEFKRRVLPDLQEDYMKTDIYLIRFLRNAKFDVPRAEKYLVAELKNRKDNNLDKIHDEDWTSFKRDYPYWVEGEDREGRPLIIISFDDWDLRRAALAGKMPRLFRYMTKIYEEGSDKVREFQAQGRNATQFEIVLGIGSVNVAQHINPSAFPFWLFCAGSFETFYKGLADKIILVDSPEIFNVVIQLIRPVVSPDTFATLTPLSKNPEQAKRLFEYIDPKYIPITFGGKKLVKYYN